MLCVFWSGFRAEGVQGVERRPPRLQAGEDGCGMSHCALLYRDDRTQMAELPSPLERRSDMPPLLIQQVVMFDLPRLG